MRKESLYRMPREEALVLLARAPTVHLATTTQEGAPVLRTLHAAVLGDRVYFHGAPVGEKVRALGREAVLSAEDTVASIPSHFVDAERACPATTYYRAVQVRGPISEVRDGRTKAEALMALMAKHQPEGGFVPIDAESPMYRKAVDGLLVASVPLERVTGKAKLGQNRTPKERARILEALWRRGGPGDARAIGVVARSMAASDLPAFLRGPASTRLEPAVHAEEDARQVAALLVGEYWNLGRFDADALLRAHLRSPAWVGARSEDGALVASARAISDGTKHASIYDVLVRPDARGRGLGEAVVRLLLEHPEVRGAAFVHLGTRDAQGLYARFGFRDAATLPPRGYASTHMVLERARA